MMRTLYDLSDLRQTGFGRPPPRHGLSLLWWFAHDCVRIDSNGRMIAQYNPENGAFGFHRFYNGGRLLPYTNLPYYEVGNLHNAALLPYYVTENYSGYSDNSNKDRIIVSFDSRLNRFDSIYVTQHSDQTNFDQNHTYDINIRLLKEIKTLNREHFCREMKNNQLHSLSWMYVPQKSNIHSHSTSSLQSLQGQRLHQSSWDFCDCNSELICALICALMLLFAVFFFLLKMANKI
uniref:Uncharacterized protein n=1 Tax=Cyprinus carpio carpio TaxID=630221 RepID=A0A9J8BZI1_CYPCA